MSVLLQDENLKLQKYAINYNPRNTLITIYSGEIEKNVLYQNYKYITCINIEKFGPGPPLFVEYLQKIYKKVTEMSIQKPF